MTDLTGGDQNTRLIISAESQGFGPVMKALKGLSEELARLKKSLNLDISGLKMDGVDRAAQQSTKSLRELNRELERAKALYPQTGKAAMAGVKGMDAARAATRRGREEIQAYQAANAKAGMAIVGRPQTWEHVKNNQRILNAGLKDASIASIATLGTFHSLGDGIERVGGRGLNSIERMNMRMFSLNRGLDSFAFNLQKSAKNLQWTGRTMFTNITLPIVGAIGVVSQEFLKMEKEMFQLQKVLEFEVDGEDLVNLRKEIQGLAIDMGLSQSATAGLYRDIAALGVAKGSLKGWAEGITQIAGIGDIEMGAATEFFRTTNALFAEGGNSGERLQSTIDLMHKMNAVADETSLQLKDLADAFPEVAPVMQQMGLEADQVAASLAGMYRRGIPATEAAHALKFGMQRLVNPTKDTTNYLSALGFAAEDFTRMEGAAFGQSALEKLALSLKGLPVEEKQKVLGEIFGARQAARMTSWSEDVTDGIYQVEQAMKDGVVTAKDLEEITSDYARSLIASNADSLGAAGIVLGDDIEKPSERFEEAVKRYLESPKLQWESLKTQFKVIFDKIGAIIVPTLLKWGKKFSEFLDKVTNAPPPFLKFISIIGALAAALGPAIIALSAFQSAFASTLKITSKIVPKGGLKDIMPDKVKRLLEENPDRQDIVRHGDKYLQKKGRHQDKIKLPKGAAGIDSSELTKISGAAKITEKSIDEIQEEVLETTLAFETMGAVGSRSAAQITAANKVMQSSFDDVVDVMGTGSADEILAASQKHADLGSQLTKDIAKATKIDLNEQVDTKRLFGSIDKDAGRSGQLSGMTWGRWFGKNADESTKGFWNKTKRMGSAVFKPHKTMGRTLSGAKDDVASSVRGGFRMAKNNLDDLAPKSGILSKMKAILPGLKTGFLGVGIVSAKVLLVFGIIVAVLGTIAAVGYSMFRSLADNWEEARKRIQPAIDRLKEAFETVKNAVMGVINAIKGGIIGTLFEDSSEGAEGMGLSWQTAADIVSGAINGVAAVFEFIAKIIGWLTPVFQWLGEIIGSTIGFIANLFSGDFKNALWYFINLIFQILKPIIWVMDVLGDIFLKGLMYVIDIVEFGVNKLIAMWTALPNAIGEGVEALAGLFGIEWDINITQAIQNAVTGVADAATGALEGWARADWVSGMEQAIDGQLKKFGSDNLQKLEPKVDEIKDEQDALGGFGDAVADATSAGVEDGAKEGLENAAESVLSGFLSALKPRVREQMDEIKETLMESFDNSVEAKLKFYDDQIKAIEDTEKAEEKLLKTEEYVQRKREMMYKRALDIQNYQRNRALAIYEGRISDVRELDLSFAVGTRDWNKEYIDMETQRQRDLIKEQRDATKERLETEKNYEKERLDIARKGYEDQLALIMEYEPRTIEEFNDMLNKLRALNAQFNIDWPASIRTGAEYYRKALSKANEDIRQDFAWSGKASIMAWTLQFIDPDVLQILYDNGVKAGETARQGVQDGFNGGGPLNINPPGGTNPQDAALWEAAAGYAAAVAADAEEKERRRGQSPVNRPPTHPAIVPPGTANTPANYGTRWDLPTNRWDTTPAASPATPAPRPAPAANAPRPAPAPTPRPAMPPIPWGPNATVPAPYASWDAYNAAMRRNLLDWIPKPADTYSQTQTWIQGGLILPANLTLGIKSPSAVFALIGTRVLAGFKNGLQSPIYWAMISASLISKISQLATLFMTAGPMMAQKGLVTFAPSMIAGFAQKFMVVNIALTGLLGMWAMTFALLPPKAIAAMSLFQLALSSWFTIQFLKVGDTVKKGVARIAQEFNGLDKKVIAVISTFGSNLSNFFILSMGAPRATMIRSVQSLADTFNGLGGKMVAAIGPFGVSIANYIAGQMVFVQLESAKQLGRVADVFKGFSSAILSGIVSGMQPGGGFANLGKDMFNALVGYINDKVIRPLRDWRIPEGNGVLGGTRPFAGLNNIWPVFHEGGVVGPNMGRGKEIAAVLQAGEGVLPLKTMRKLGPKGFELLRRGIVGDAVALAASGKVIGRMPSIGSASLSGAVANSGVKSETGQNVYISVDTFIGEEQWFKSMAEKYDMKVTARKAKANGSQSRVISSYNSNERNTYR
jgi:TP901 family phage tail tape measure protein